ncbi:MAG: hypothetical protein K8R63_00575 [Bacteroidales bacterium]|nr:hypothetical protein [Bacteroidales bacterium]
MKNTALLEEIGKITSILDGHIKRVMKNPGQLHEIDIDLMSGKLKEIYALVHELQSETSYEAASETEKMEPEKEVENTEIPQDFDVKEDIPHAEKEPEPGTVLSAEEEDKTIEEKPIETETARVSDPEVEPEIEAKKRPEEKEPIMPEAKTTADLFSGTATIADSFQEGEDKSIAANMIHQPVQDLKMAIGINDKFLFINELFGGSPSDYNEAIEKLNLAEGLPEAENTLADYETQHKWDGNSEASNRLKQLIEKKFN